MTAQFPAAVPTTAGLFGNLVNNLATLLNGALTIGATTIVVDDTTGFPAAGYGTIHNPDFSGSYEIFQYTGKTGTSFTGVTRGVGGSTAVAWADNSALSQFWVADHHNHHCEETIAIAQNINDRFGLNTSIAIPSGISFTINSTGGLAITPVTNQIVLGATQTVTITAPTPATSSRTWTIPDITGNGTFAALEGAQTFTGVKTFSSHVFLGGVGIDLGLINIGTTGTANGTLATFQNNGTVDLDTIYICQTSRHIWVDHTNDLFCFGRDSSTKDFSLGATGIARFYSDVRGEITTGSATVAYFGDPPNIASQNSKTMTITIANSAKVFIIYTDSGDSALVYANFIQTTITILGTNGAIVASGSPTANQIGITKSANSHVINFITGSTFSGGNGNIKIMSLGGRVTAVTAWA